KRARGVEIIDAETGLTYQYTARVIFLNASAFNSTWILMNSATDVWQGGLGSSWGELGHNVMDHHFEVGEQGVVDGYEDRNYSGHPPCGYDILRFRNDSNDRRENLHGFGYEGRAGREGWSRAVAELGIGTGLKEALSTPGAWTIGMTAFGEMLPYHDNTIRLDHSVRDKWGLPVLAMDVSIRDNERAMRKDMAA